LVWPILLIAKLSPLDGRMANNCWSLHTYLLFYWFYTYLWIHMICFENISSECPSYDTTWSSIALSLSLSTLLLPAFQKFLFELLSKIGFRVGSCSSRGFLKFLTFSQITFWRRNFKLKRKMNVQERGWIKQIYGTISISS
jgi:hypothetical protein